ncbi:MAG: ABC-2 family transporter protein [Patescibacteria group bacterium]|nr:ABC-2 family transporter protein [Patescibacteria group bacterium]
MKAWLKELPYWLKIFRGYSLLSVRTVLESRTALVLFALGKLIRFLFFFGILILVFKKTSQLSGWTSTQTFLIFFLFNFLDSLTQMIFREVYRFRSLLISGNLDLILTKPHPPLLKVLLGGIDLIDLGFIGIFFLLVNIFLFWEFQGWLNLLLFWLFFANSLVILTSVHLLILALAIFTTDVDHTIFIYRDLFRLGQFPVEIYQQPLTFLFTFVLPLGLITILPVGTYYWLTNWSVAIFGLTFSLIFFCLSLTLWQRALRFYQSASS